MGRLFVGRFNLLLLLAASAAAGTSVGLLNVPRADAREPDGPFRNVEPFKLPLDRAGVWTLHFAYLPPRSLFIDEPGKARREVWYLLYQVWNTVDISDTPVTFIPEFELVTKDGELRKFADAPHPSIVKQIRANEDKTGALNIQTSISISKTKIPVTKLDSIARAVYGVAVWQDAPDLAPNVNNFSIYISGLSNGLAVSESDKGAETISRKALQLDFLCPVDKKQRITAKITASVKINDNNGLGSEKWIYRVIPVHNKTAPAPEKKDGDK